MSMEATISDTVSLSQLQSFDSVKYSSYSENSVLNNSNVQVTATDNILSTPESPTMGNISDMPSTVEITTDESFDKTNNSSETDKISDNIYEDSSNEEANDIEKSDDMQASIENNICSVNQKDDSEENEKLLSEIINEDDKSPEKQDIIQSTTTSSREFRNSVVDDPMINNLFKDDDLIDLTDENDAKVELTNFQLEKIDTINNSENAKLNLIDVSEVKCDKSEILSEIKDSNLPKVKPVESSLFVEVPQEKHSVHFDMKDNINHKVCDKFVSSENSFRASSVLSEGLFSSTDASKSPFSLRKQFGLEKLSPVSPVEESRRRFESEIGRTIVRDRKMKLEMEQIQAERQRNDLKKQVLVSPGESSTNNKSYVKLRHHSSEEIPCSKLAENRIYDNSDVWRSIGKHSNSSSCEKDRKRGSDPQDILSRFRTEQIYLEQKRSSEPKCIYFERKSSVKELLSKFEPKSPKDNNTSHQQLKRELFEIPKAQLDICNDCKMGTTAPVQIPLMKSHNESSGMKVRSESERQDVYHSLPDFSFQPSSTVQRSSSSTSVPSVFSSKTGKLLLSRCCSHESQVTPVKVICSKTVLKSPIAIRPQSLSIEKSTKTLIRESPDASNRNTFLSHVNINNEISNSSKKCDGLQQISSNIGQSSYQDYHLQTSGKELFYHTKSEERDSERKDQSRLLYSNILEESQENSEPVDLLSNNRHIYNDQEISTNAVLHSNTYGKKDLHSSATSSAANELHVTSLSHHKNLTASSRTPKCSSVINSLVQESKTTTNIKFENSNLDVPKSKK